MPRFLVLYRADTSADAQLAETTPAAAEEGMAAWMQWAGKAGGALVDLGSPLAYVETVADGRADGLPIGGFSILEAGARGDVVALLADHPHLRTPGTTAIEVLEFLPIPGA